MEYELPTERKNPRIFCYGILFVFVCIILLASGRGTLSFLNTAPQNFPTSEDITIDSGLTLNEISKVLQEKNLIRSSLYFYFVARTAYEDMYAQAGMYQFSSPQTTQEIVEAIMHGTNQSPRIKITFPEGFRARDIFTFLPTSFATTSTDIEQYEGYLFPDTYFINADMSINDVVTLLRSTYTEKMQPLQEKITTSGLSEEEIIILASIIEREAKDVASKKIVSGILQNRLRIGMALQVDASFDYLFDKTSSEVTGEDLEHDSAYNSYRHAGLPPTPISNPGIESIMAVLEPTESKYLYYLTDPEGTFHYAETFEEHKRNKERYLR